MQSIIAGGVSWGMGEDAIDESTNEEDIDWKVHALKNSLTDKQQKLVDKIRYRLPSTSLLKPYSSDCPMVGKPQVCLKSIVM